MVLKHQLPSGGPREVAKKVAQDAAAKTYNVAGWAVAFVAVGAVAVWLHKRGLLPLDRLPGAQRIAAGAGALTDDLGTRLG